MGFIYKVAVLKQINVFKLLETYFLYNSMCVHI